MKRYRNIHGDSGVVAYEIGTDSVVVKFRSGPLYRYSYQSAGRRKVETMKRLATSGAGLSAYISRFVKDGYEGA